MHEWITRLRKAIEQENSDRPLVMTLATVSRKGSPRARSVICRKITDEGDIWITSDARSKKGEQIQRNRRVELVIWLPTVRRQYRLRGKAHIISAEDSTAKELWAGLSDASKAMFFWHSVGEQRPTASPPDTFEAIAICPTRVEELDLTVEPHRVWRWSEKGGRKA
jgi:pyridoxamine 5'-phosphate oxidase